jgi:phospholipid/cholesterol/gamma-HCH transport system substrate-binding protein
MRNSRINYIMVGAFTIIVVVGLVVSIALLTGRTGAVSSYHTVFQSVPGIARGTQVLFQGYPVGQVEAIELIEHEGRQRYRVELNVRTGWQIPDDSVAFLTTGLLAAVNVNIEGGTSRTFLSPGGEIRSNEPADIFTTLQDVAGDVDELMDQAKDMVAEDIRPLLTTFSEELQVVSHRVTELLSAENVAHVQQIMANLHTTSDDVAKLAAELRTTRTTADDLLQRIDTVVEKNQGNVDQSLLDLRYSLEAVAGHIDAVNRNLEGTSRNMNEFSRQIRANPSLLLRGKAPPVEEDGTPQ